MKISQYVQVIEELKKKVKELECKLTLSIPMPAIKEQPNLAKEKGEYITVKYVCM